MNKFFSQSGLFIMNAVLLMALIQGVAGLPYKTQAPKTNPNNKLESSVIADKQEASLNNKEEINPTPLTTPHKNLIPTPSKYNSSGVHRYDERERYDDD